MKQYLIIACYLLFCLSCIAGGEKNALVFPSVVVKPAIVPEKTLYGFQISAGVKQMPATKQSSDVSVRGLQAGRQAILAKEEGLISPGLLVLLGVILLLGMAHNRQVY